MFSSAAMNQLTKNLACEWAKDNIRANTVAPWYTRTSLVEPVRLSTYPVISLLQVFVVNEQCFFLHILCWEDVGIGRERTIIL